MAWNTGSSSPGGHLQLRRANCSRSSKSLLASAKHLCGAEFGIILLREGDAFRTVALHGATAEYTEARWRCSTRLGALYLLALLGRAALEIILRDRKGPKHTELRCPSEREPGNRATFPTSTACGGGWSRSERLTCARPIDTQGTPTYDSGRSCGTLKARRQDVWRDIDRRGARSYGCGRASCPSRESWCPMIP